MIRSHILPLFFGAISGMTVIGEAQASEWRFVRVDSEPAQGAAELTIGEDGRLSGTTGCNRFSGQVSYAELVLDVAQPFTSTRMACADPAIDLQERALFELFKGPVSVEYDPYLEELILSGNDHVAVLTPLLQASTGGLPPVFGAKSVVVSGLSSLLNFRAEPTTVSGVIARLRPRSIHTNLGCESREDRDWCRLSLEDGTIGWASAEYLSPLTLGARAKEGNYDRIGRLPCSEADLTTEGRCEYGSSIEGDRAIVSVFVDEGAPAVLHFSGRSFDSMASFGPFAADDGKLEEFEGGVRLIARGFELEIPLQAMALSE